MNEYQGSLVLVAGVALLVALWCEPVAGQAAPGEFTTADREFYFRNVKDFGAVGDGVADDTAAIQRAINHNQGSRGEKNGGLVFIPAGTYKITERLNLWKATYFVGDPLDPPTLVLPANSPGFQDPAQPNALIATWNGWNCDPEDPWFYQVPMPITFYDKDDPNLAAANNNFYVVIGNLKIHLEPGNPGAVGLYARLAQQTMLENLTVTSTDALRGIWGTPNLLRNITIEGGEVGYFVSGPTAITFRNMTIRNTRGPALELHGTWSMNFQNLTIEDCGYALSANHGATLSLVNTTIRRTRQPYAMQLEGGEAYFFSNLVCEDVPEIIPGQLPGQAQGTVTIPTYVLGDLRVGQPTEEPGERFEGWAAEAARRPAGVVDDVCLAATFAREPQPPLLPAVNLEHPGNVVRYGARGDGETDDTAALQQALDENEIVFLPMGRYRVTDTLRLQADTKLIGEHVLRSTLQVPQDAPAFDDPDHPKAVISTPEVADSTVVLKEFRVWVDRPGGVGVDWRCGGQAHISNVHIGGAHFAAVRMTDFGGGVLELLWLPHDRSRYGVYAEDCQGPAWFYGVGCEHQTQVPYLLRNVRDFTFVTPQTETSPIDMVIENSDRVVSLGQLSGNWRGMWTSYLIKDSTNVLVAGHTVCRTLYSLRDAVKGHPGAAGSSPELTVFGHPQRSRAWRALGLYVRGDFAPR